MVPDEVNLRKDGLTANEAAMPIRRPPFYSPGSLVYGRLYRNLYTALYTSRSHVILVHTICFALEQTRDDSCITKHSSSVRNTSNKSTKHENRPSQHLRNIVTGCFPSTLLVKCFYFILTSVATREGFRAAQFLLRCWSV